MNPLLASGSVRFPAMLYPMILAICGDDFNKHLYLKASFSRILSSAEDGEEIAKTP